MTKQHNDDEIRKLVEQRESAELNDSSDAESDINTNTTKSVEERHQDALNERYVKSNGKLLIKSDLDLDESESASSIIHGANDVNYKNIPFDILPSKGMFYPIGSEITIRAASVLEIRHWSTIDDTDLLDMNDKLNFIIEKCLRFKTESGIASWKDIKEIDRFFLVFKIRELTFPSDENSIHILFSCDSYSNNCDYKKNVKLTSLHLRLFNLHKDLQDMYDSEKRCFVKFSEKLNETLEFHVPSIGTMMYMNKKVKEYKESHQNIDPSYLKVAPFFISDWRKLKDDSYEKLKIRSYSWNMDKFLAISWFIDTFKNGVDLTIKHNCEKCDAVLERPLFFRGGFTIKDLFSISSRPDSII